MSQPAVGLTGGGILALAGLALAGLVAWTVYRRAPGLVASVAQSARETVADLAQPLRDLAAPLASGGDPVRAALYSREGYTGENAAGELPTAAGWLATEEGRRYTYDEAQRAAARGQAAPVSSQAGAAFGVYAPAGRRRAPGYVDVMGAQSADDASETARIIARWQAGQGANP